MSNKLGKYLIVSVFLCSPAYAGGDGAGTNGPDLNGVSIPARADRALTQEDLLIATGRCGRAALKSIYRQLFKKDFVPSGTWSEEAYPTQDAGVGYKDGYMPHGASHTSDPAGKEMRTFVQAFVIDEAGCQLNLKDEGFLGNSGTLNIEFYGSTCNPAARGFTLSSASKSPLPYFEFTERATSPIYDEFGNLVSYRNELSDVILKIDIPADLPVVFKNATTGITIPVQFDQSAYSACLQAEVQNTGTTVR